MGKMREINLEATRSTPAIRFDPMDGKLTIIGQSYPENAFAFYQPLLEWIDEYLESRRAEAGLSAELQLPYINTSSTKCLLMLLERLENAFLEGVKVSVRWYYDEDNDSELECAEEFKEDLTLPFHIVAKTAENHDQNG